MKRKQLIGIGLCTTIALYLVIQTLLLLNPTPGDKKLTARVRFQNIEKIVPGTQVTFAGKPIGIVSKISFLPEALSQRSATAQYPYELTLKLDSSIKLFPKDIVTIRTAGLMGDRSIAIIPMPATSLQDNTAIPGEPLLYAKDTLSVEDTVETVSSVLTQIETTMQKLSSAIEKTEPTLLAATNNLNTILTTINNDQLVGKISTLASTGTDCLQKVDTLVETALHGKGTITYLLQSDTGAQTIENVATKTNKLLDAIREYGFFFASNSTYKKALAQERQNMQNPEKKS